MLNIMRPHFHLQLFVLGCPGVNPKVCKYQPTTRRPTKQRTELRWKLTHELVCQPRVEEESPTNSNLTQNYTRENSPIISSWKFIVASRRSLSHTAHARLLHKQEQARVRSGGSVAGKVPWRFAQLMDLHHNFNPHDKPSIIIISVRSPPSTCTDCSKYEDSK